ncbi:heterokaryon incompatibility protein-domain-containing protein [Phyllosticta capitalensis]|uniref:Heterokaryon incompatibility protein-domain-containing protein n=1 Tax=Phyllosticta capitalensis TaxID=121624 RepID=A0ABR1Y8X3_9PEZI
MADEPPRYQHKPLKGAKAFRLVELQPGEKDDALRCDIKIVSLDEQPQYEALSYIRGIPEHASPGITVQGPSNTMFKVTTTCRRALRNLRHPTASRLLWIDQLCIDQGSLEEKGQQVRLMDDIYKSATRVFVDPAGAVGWRDLDLASLLSILNWGRRDRNEPELPVLPRIKKRYDQLTEVYEMEGKPNSEGWCHEVLVFLTWFERTWAVQEVALAKEAVMIVGSLEIPFYEVLDIFVGQFKEHYAGYKHRAKCEHPARLQLHASVRGAPNRSLLELAYDARSLKTTKPEDRLYSLVGLASDGEDYKHAVDYIRPVNETFAEFSRLFINQSRRLGPLSLVSECRASPDVPSWVIQWDKIETRFPALLNPFDAGAHFNASGNFKLAAKQEASNSGALHLRGVVVDSLLTADQWPSLQFATPGNERPSKSMKEWQQLPLSKEKHSQIQVLASTIRHLRRQLLARDDLHYPNLDTALLNTLTCGKLRNRIDVLVAKLAGSDDQVLDHMIPRPDPVFVKLEDRWGYGILHDTTAAWNSYRLEWRFAQTASGYVGLVPDAAVQGDVVAVLAGGGVPYMLREVPGEKEGTYRLVGPAYVEGIMGGEAMEGKAEEELRDFVIV